MHYEYLVKPYGLSNAPSVFQNFMSEIFREMIHRFVIVYIDDILIYSSNLFDHTDHVRQVLNRLRHYHLYLKLEKCLRDPAIQAGSKPSHSSWKALETAEALFNNVFRHFGIPEDIVSDRGPQFISRVWCGFFRMLGVSVSLSSMYHPQTNGQTEWKIQEIRRYLRAYGHNHQHNWSQYLPWAKYAQNSLCQQSTGLWLATRDIRLRLPCIGPFTILRQINEVTYELSPTFHVSLLKPFTDPVLPPSTEPEVPPPPEVDNDYTIYQVREIVNSR
ncbi:hypothetical protein QTP86_029823 [Hemibagrus guttatus]|nr:hypothetical protein QTP86_029823 [Hemibagrus guttatus]